MQNFLFRICFCLLFTFLAGTSIFVLSKRQTSHWFCSQVLLFFCSDKNGDLTQVVNNPGLKPNTADLCSLSALHSDLRHRKPCGSGHLNLSKSSACHFRVTMDNATTQWNCVLAFDRKETGEMVSRERDRGREERIMEWGESLNAEAKLRKILPSTRRTGKDKLWCHDWVPFNACRHSFKIHPASPSPFCHWIKSILLPHGFISFYFRPDKR